MEDSATISMKQRCAVVTGGNKGTGYEICRQLALKGIKVVLTARNEAKGVAAVPKLNTKDVVFHQLDVKDPTSVASLAEFIATHFQKLDILINNAGELGGVLQDNINSGGSDLIAKNLDGLLELIKEPYKLGEECLKTNYYGTKRVTRALFPFLQLSNSPRIVNVSSILGELHWISNEKVKGELQDIENLTEEKTDEIIGMFLRDFKANKLSENGWPEKVSAYKVSKVAINAYTRVMARKLPNMLVNCVHPGYVITDFTYNTGDITAKEGAKAPRMVALLLDDGPSGAYFNQMQIAPF